MAKDAQAVAKRANSTIYDLEIASEDSKTFENEFERYFKIDVSNVITYVETFAYSDGQSIARKIFQIMGDIENAKNLESGFKKYRYQNRYNITR